MTKQTTAVSRKSACKEKITQFLFFRLWQWNMTCLLMSCSIEYLLLHVQVSQKPWRSSFSIILFLSHTLSSFSEWSQPVRRWIYAMWSSTCQPLRACSQVLMQNHSLPSWLSAFHNKLAIVILSILEEQAVASSSFFSLTHTFQSLFSFSLSLSPSST